MKNKYKAGDRILSIGSGKRGTIIQHLGTIYPEIHTYKIQWDIGMISARMESTLQLYHEEVQAITESG